MALPQATFRIDEFKSQVLTKGLARQNRFEVIINAPPQLITYQAKVASLLAEATNLPPINIEVQSQKIFGPRYQRPKSIEMGGDGLIINFLVDKDMVIKRFFEEWINSVIEPDTYLVEYQNNYISTIVLNQLDEKDEITYSVTLLEAFPRSMNIMELNHSSNNMFHRLSIAFAYRYWTSKPLGSKSDIRTLSPLPTFRENIETNKRQSTNLDNFVTVTGEPNQATGGGSINSLGVSP